MRCVRAVCDATLASMRAIGYRHINPVADGVDTLANALAECNGTPANSQGDSGPGCGPFQTFAGFRPKIAMRLNWPSDPSFRRTLSPSADPYSGLARAIRPTCSRDRSGPGKYSLSNSKAPVHQPQVSINGSMSVLKGSKTIPGMSSSAPVTVRITPAPITTPV